MRARARPLDRDQPAVDFTRLRGCCTDVRTVSSVRARPDRSPHGERAVTLRRARPKRSRSRLRLPGEQLCSFGRGSPIGRAASRLALRATARGAAAALTRPARWAAVRERPVGGGSKRLKSGEKERSALPAGGIGSTLWWCERLWSRREVRAWARGRQARRRARLWSHLEKV